MIFRIGFLIAAVTILLVAGTAVADTVTNIGGTISSDLAPGPQADCYFDTSFSIGGSNGFSASGIPAAGNTCLDSGGPSLPSPGQTGVVEITLDTIAGGIRGHEVEQGSLEGLQATVGTDMTIDSAPYTLPPLTDPAWVNGEISVSGIPATFSGTATGYYCDPLQLAYTGACGTNELWAVSLTGTADISFDYYPVSWPTENFNVTLTGGTGTITYMDPINAAEPGSLILLGLALASSLGVAVQRKGAARPGI